MNKFKKIHHIDISFENSVLTKKVKKFLKKNQIFMEASKNFSF